jgi:hypothetical protein
MVTEVTEEMWLDVLAHWTEAVANPHRTFLGARDCAFCRSFAYEVMYVCKGCPIKEKTGETKCRETPYWDSIAAGVDVSVRHKAIIAELGFLRALYIEWRLENEKTT